MQSSQASTFDTTALGHYIAQCEIAVYEQAVANVFGFHALQLGWPGYDLLAQCRIPYKHYLNTTLTTHTSMLCESEFLPLAETSVDLVCLPHILEQCSDPQQALREAFRVLVPEGTLILTGISPLSCLGLRASMGWFKQAGQFQRLFTAHRMRDWLNVLGFEVVQSHYLMHAFPLNDIGWLERQSWLEKWGARTYGMTGGVYFLMAKKRVLNVRLLKPDWKKAPLNPALQVQKGRPRVQNRVQKQLECADVDRTLD
ncbi:Methyltransferase domain-containing protein [Methylophilus rhizosphaerae]|uniref:Methyltransferase domain-containing protein n=1 Tax=Methylophilus rhizosphaerae TaxID=492660 RepID=A0A1G9ATX4_9PROT|nr:methyltransferase domain-containing protein [Methylophilus rhizosphaerae]SDK30673.1 Methyltransferase domain-containing protein [Methylophilus rhizosphaerae]